MSIICMTDIETLGTARNATILQIGMVIAEVHKKEGTGEILDKLSLCLDWKAQIAQENRIVEPDTLEWWFNQPEAVIKSVVCYDGNKRYGLLKSLGLINKFLQIYDIREYWSKGNFDYPILEDVFEQYRLSHICPWKYRQIRDFRTMLKFAQDMGFQPSENIQHDALEDAVQQTQDLIRIFQFFSETDS